MSEIWKDYRLVHATYQQLCDIYRINKGLILARCLLVIKREISAETIRAIPLFNTSEEKDLAVEYIKTLDVTVSQKLVEKRPILRWEEIIKLNIWDTSSMGTTKEAATQFVIGSEKRSFS